MNFSTSEIYSHHLKTGLIRLISVILLVIVCLYVYSFQDKEYVQQILLIQMVFTNMIIMTNLYLK